MKITYLFVIGAIILIIISGGGTTLYNHYSNNGVFEAEINKQLESVAKAKANRVGLFLNERKFDIEFLSQIPEVRELIKENGSANNDLNNRLSSFREINKYLDLIITSPSGNVLWSGSNKELIGANLNSKKYKESKLAEVYEKVQNDFGVGIFDPGYFGLENKLSVFVTTPVIEENKTSSKKEIIGILALQIDNAQIENLITSDAGFGKIGQTYLVKRDGTPITTLHSNKGEVITEINSQMYKECFKDYNNYYYSRKGQQSDEIVKSGLFKNYQNQKVFGSHQYILETGWCTMVEVDADKYLKLHTGTAKTKMKSISLVIAAGLVYFLLIVIILERYISLKKIKVGKR